MEIGERLALALEELQLDVEDEHVPAPAVLDGGLDITAALGRVFDLAQNGAIASCGLWGCRDVKPLCASIVRGYSAPTLLVIDEAARVATPCRGALKHYLRGLHH